MNQIEKNNLQGLGGWLILVIIGLVITPIRLSLFILSDFVPIFTDGTWQALTVVTSSSYHALWAQLIIFEMTGNLAIIILSLVTMYFMFRKSKRTPTVAITWYAVGFVFVVADFFLASMIPAIADMPTDFETVKEISRASFGVLIWIPYFLFSKRVKATFIE